MFTPKSDKKKKEKKKYIRITSNGITTLLYSSIMEDALSGDRN